MKSLLIQTFCLLFLCLGTVRAQQYQLASPNGKLSVTVDAGEALTWQIAHDGTTVLQPSAIALQGRDEKSAKKAITFVIFGILFLVPYTKDFGRITQF